MFCVPRYPAQEIPHLILIDDRGGATAASSGEHYPTRLSELIPNSILTRLDSGDVAFEAHDGTMVGIELKRVTDAVSCMFSSRLADGQLPAMSEQYGVRYLIVEGLYRSKPDSGVLQTWKWFRSDKGVVCGTWYDARAGKNKLTYSSFEMWLKERRVMLLCRTE